MSQIGGMWNDVIYKTGQSDSAGTPVLCETSTNWTRMPPKTADVNNHANQLNPNSEANKAASDNRANQLNPNHAASKGGGK